MSVVVTNVIQRMLYRGAEDLDRGWPVGIWWVHHDLTGDGSGGTTVTITEFQASAGPNVGQFFSLEQLFAETDDQTDRNFSIRSTNFGTGSAVQAVWHYATWVKMSSLGVASGFSLSDPERVRSYRGVFLGRPQGNLVQATLATSGVNTGVGVTFHLWLAGYVWSPGAIMSPQGIRRPPDALWPG